MKIIGHTSKDSVLVQMTRLEFSNVVGKNYDTEMVHGRWPNEKDGFEVGTEYTVSDIYNRLRRQESVSAQLEQASKSLEALADLVRHVAPTAKLLTEQPEGGVV